MKYNLSKDEVNEDHWNDGWPDLIISENNQFNGVSYWTVILSCCKVDRHQMMSNKWFYIQKTTPFMLSCGLLPVQISNERNKKDPSHTATIKVTRGLTKESGTSTPQWATGHRISFFFLFNMLRPLARLSLVFLFFSFFLSMLNLFHTPLCSPGHCATCSLFPPDSGL